jgi:hypothetical protein
MISFIYIYENKNKKSGVAQPLPLGHMRMVETTPILLGGGLATPVAQRGGSATPNGQSEKKKKKIRFWPLGVARSEGGRATPNGQNLIFYLLLFFFTCHGGGSTIPLAKMGVADHPHVA